MTRFFSACEIAAGAVGAATGAGAGARSGSGARAGGAAATGAGAGSGAAAAAAGAAGALDGSNNTPMMLSETPAFFSFTMSPVVRLTGLFSLWMLLMIRLSESPALTDAITSSIRDVAVLAAAFGAALGAGAGVAVWPNDSVTKKLTTAVETNSSLSFIFPPHSIDRQNGRSSGGRLTNMPNFYRPPTRRSLRRAQN